MPAATMVDKNQHPRFHSAGGNARRSVHDRERLDSASGDVYIRTAEAAKILGRSPKTISRWARDGKLPHLVTLGGHRRFPAVAVYELARQMEGGLRVVRDVQR